MNGNNVEQVLDALAERLGRRVGYVRKAYTLDYFSYEHDYLPVAANAEGTTNFLVQADSGFVIVKTMGVITDTTNAFVANLTDAPKFSPFTLIWTDTGSGRDLMNQRIPYDNIVGSGQRPYFWPKPKVLDPNSTFVGRILNLSATARNVRITFSGYKVFGDLTAFKRSH